MSLFIYVCVSFLLWFVLYLFIYVCIVSLFLAALFVISNFNFVLFGAGDSVVRIVRILSIKSRGSSGEK